jgi:hypothetical protein
MTPPGEPKRSYVFEPLLREGQSCDLEIEAGDENLCHAKECWRTAFCDCCAHECDVCHCLFCRRDILVITSGRTCEACADEAADFSTEAA